MEESKYQKLDARAKKCMRLNALIGSVFVILCALVPMLIIGIGAMPVWLWICYAVLSALLIAWVIAMPNVRYARYRYAIDEEAIRVREGFLWISYSVVPIERLHKIELSQGPVARLFGLYTVNVTTAGGEVSIKFIPEAVATQIAEHLKDIVNRLVAEERGQADGDV